MKSQKQMKSPMCSVGIMTTKNTTIMFNFPQSATVRQMKEHLQKILHLPDIQKSQISLQNFDDMELWRFCRNDEHHSCGFQLTKVSQSFQSITEEQNAKKLKALQTAKNKQIQETQFKYAAQLSHSQNYIKRMNTFYENQIKRLESMNKATIFQFNGKFNQFSKKLEQLQEINRKKTFENQQLIKKMSEIENKSSKSEYQNRRKFQQQEKKKIAEYERKIELISKDNHSNNKKKQFYERKLTQLSQQMERLIIFRRNSGIYEKGQKQGSTISSTSQQNENLRKYYQELLRKAKDTLEAQMLQKSSIYQTNLFHLTHQNEELKKINKEYEIRLTKYSQKFDNFILNLKDLKLENDNLLRQQNNLSTSNLEINRALQGYEQILQACSKQNQELKRKVIQLVNNITEHENRRQTEAEEIERLNKALKKLSLDTDFLGNQLKQVSEAPRYYQTTSQDIEILNKSTQKLMKYIQEIENLKKNLFQSQSKIQKLYSQNQYLKLKLIKAYENQLLREQYQYTLINKNQEFHVKQETQNRSFDFEKSKIQKQINISPLGNPSRFISSGFGLMEGVVGKYKIQMPNFNVKESLQDYENLIKLNSDMKALISNHEIEIKSIVKANNQNTSKLMARNEQLQQFLNQSQLQIKKQSNKYDSLAEYYQRSFNQKMKVLKSQNENLKLKIIEVESNITQINQQMERMINAFQSKLDKYEKNFQFQEKQINLRDQELRRVIQEYQNKLKFITTKEEKYIDQLNEVKSSLKQMTEKIINEVKQLGGSIGNSLESMKVLIKNIQIFNQEEKNKDPKINLSFHALFLKFIKENNQEIKKQKAIIRDFTTFMTFLIEGYHYIQKKDSFLMKNLVLSKIQN